MNKYRFERISEKHYPDLIYISKSAFDIDPGINFFKSKNNNALFGETHLGYIAYSVKDNEPSAFYGVYSYPFLINGTYYAVVQSGDTMTHKSHVGKGLFTTLAKMTYALAKEKGATLVFGFPNDNSYPGFVRKLDWIHRDNINLYKIKVQTLPFLKLAKKISFLNPLYKLYLKFIDQFFKADVNFFQNSVIETDTGGILHNKEFVSYKSFNGGKIISINKTPVWLKPDGFLFIGDIDRKASENFGKFISSLKYYAFFTGSDIIQFGFSPDSFWDKIFSKSFEEIKGAAFGYLKFDDNFPIEKFHYTQADIDTF
jgi:hypothetical protein